MADGAEAWALYAANNSAIKVNGNISASGDEAIGAVARGSGSVISISNGTMDMNGADTLAMLVNAGGSITLDNALVNANGSALLLSTSSYGSVDASNGSALYSAVTNNTSKN